MLEAAQRQHRYRQAMHRAVNAYRLLILDEIGYFTPAILCAGGSAFNRR
jgi:hypothetical protein